MSIGIFLVEKRDSDPYFVNAPDEYHVDDLQFDGFPVNWATIPVADGLPPSRKLPHRSPDRFRWRHRSFISRVGFADKENRLRRKTSPRRRLYYHKIKMGASSRHWRSVVRSYWCSLHKTKLAAASPFHCRLVSPGSKKAFLRALRTMLTIWSFAEVASAGRDGDHTSFSHPKESRNTPKSV
jgi:hypothetical protein